MFPRPRITPRLFDADAIAWMEEHGNRARSPSGHYVGLHRYEGVSIEEAKKLVAARGEYDCYAVVVDLPESPALQMIRHAWTWVPKYNRAYQNATAAIVETAIRAGLRFDKEDLLTASRKSDFNTPEAGVSLSLSEAERWYALAVCENHKSAMAAIEHALGRKRYVIDGKVLVVPGWQVPLGKKGRVSFDWPGAVTAENPVGVLNVVRFSPDGKSVVVTPDTPGERAIAEGHHCKECGTWKPGVRTRPRARRKVQSITWEEIHAFEQARIAVKTMAFEFPSTVAGDAALNETTGETAVRFLRAHLVRVAALKVGETIDVPPVDAADPIGVYHVRRIAAVTHDALAYVANPNGGYYGPRRPKEEALTNLVDQGLATVATLGRGGWNPTTYALTDAGRERLAQLTLPTRLRGSDATPFDESPDEPTGFLATLTEEQLATVATYEDSRRAGNCHTGTMQWINEHAPGRTEMTIRELLTLAGDRDRYNIEGIVRVALARAAKPAKEATA